MPKVRIKYEGLDIFQRKLDLLAQEATAVAAAAVYDGAGIAANAMRTSVEGLRRVPDVVAINAWRKGEASVLSVSQKIGLIEGLGIAPMKVTPSSVNTKVGFGGYNNVKTKRWPNGQPNTMVAGNLNHGSSNFLQRQPFITAVKDVYASEIRKAMMKAATAKIDEILKG